MKKLIYHYRPDTGEYAAQSEADESPLEPGVYLLPASATFAPPPKPRSGCVAVFRDSEWHIEEDHRGTTYWLANGSRYTVSSIGPMPAGALDKPPPPSPERVAAIKRSARDAALTATDWAVSRHQDELLAGSDTTLDQAQITTLISYRRALRDLSTAPQWPHVELPAPPEFLTKAS